MFEMEEAIMFAPKKEEYIDHETGEKKQRQVKYYPDAYKNRIGRSYNDYAQYRQMNLFEDFYGYEDENTADNTDSKPVKETNANQEVKEQPGEANSSDGFAGVLSSGEATIEKEIYTGEDDRQ